VDDVAFFLDRYGSAPRSLYSFEAARSDVIALLEARA
jgi:hypothetical protein